MKNSGDFLSITKPKAAGVVNGFQKEWLLSVSVVLNLSRNRNNNNDDDFKRRRGKKTKLNKTTGRRTMRKRKSDYRERARPMP